MTEIRCVKCKRLLLKAFAVDGEIKCGKCGQINYVIMHYGLAASSSATRFPVFSKEVLDEAQRLVSLAKR